MALKPLMSICCIMFTVKDMKIVACGHELTLLLSSLSLRSTSIVL